jgi:transcriptional antiterminator RfaH
MDIVKKIPPPNQIDPAKRPLVSKKWYVVEVHHGKSKYAINNLNMQGFATFYPHFRSCRKHGGGLRNLLVPFFPRYVFINAALGLGEVRAINSTYGVKGLLTSHTCNPSSVSADVMQNLLMRCDDEGVSSCGLSYGDKVRFISGPFYGHLASIENLDVNGRIMVLFQLLGVENRLIVERSVIASVEG